MPSAALLLSGGIDSTAVACWKRPLVAITVDYGQTAAQAEIEAATIITRDLRISHRIFRTELYGLGSGVMAGLRPTTGAPSPEWWPFRNQLLVTLGAMLAIQEGCTEVLIGTVASDNIHADGKPEFVRSLDSLLRMQEGQMRLIAPAVDISSEELVEISGIPDSVLAWCHSCHTGNCACGFCRGCDKNYAIKQTRAALREVNHLIR